MRAGDELPPLEIAITRTLIVAGAIASRDFQDVHHDAELAIVDLSMPGMSGLDLIARLKREFPRLRVLVLSMHAEEQYALRAFQAGANGYVTKDRAPAELVTAVAKVAGGGAYVTASLAEHVVRSLNGAQAVPRHAHLSNRELEVLKRLVAGRRPSDIADELPDTGGREALWFTIDEFEQQPRRPISDPLVAILRAAERGEQVEPQAVWLPA